MRLVLLGAWLGAGLTPKRATPTNRNWRRHSNAQKMTDGTNSTHRRIWPRLDVLPGLIQKRAGRVAARVSAGNPCPEIPGNVSPTGYNADCAYSTREKRPPEEREAPPLTVLRPVRRRPRLRRLRRLIHWPWWTVVPVVVGGYVLE